MEQRFYKKTWFVVLMLIFIFAFALIIIASFKHYKGDKKTINTSADGLKSTKVTEEAKMPEKQLTSITASYSGDTTEGIEINNSSQITATATYADGSVEVVSGWSIANPSTLVAEQTSSYEVSYNGLSCNVDITCTTLTEATYKAQCQSVEYGVFGYNANSYKDKYVKFTGKIIKILEDEDNGVLLRVNVTKDENGTWRNTMLASYTYKDGEQRYSVGDIITFYGKYAGYLEQPADSEAEAFFKVFAEYIDLD